MSFFKRRALGRRIFERRLFKRRIFGARFLGKSGVLGRRFSVGGEGIFRRGVFGERGVRGRKAVFRGGGGTAEGRKPRKTLRETRAEDVEKLRHEGIGEKLEDYRHFFVRVRFSVEKPVYAVESRKRVGIGEKRSDFPEVGRGFFGGRLVQEKEGGGKYQRKIIHSVFSFTCGFKSGIRAIYGRNVDF